MIPKILQFLKNLIFSENILKYFRTFNVYIPDKQMKERLLTQTKPKMLSDKDKDN